MRHLIVGLLWALINTYLYAQIDTTTLLYPTTSLHYLQPLNNKIPPLAPQTAAQWQWAVDKQQGIIGNDFWGKQEIGTATLRRPLTFAPKWYWAWLKPYTRPQDMGHAYKQTLCGELSSTFHTLSSKAESLFFKDNDLSFHISPDKDFAYMLNDVSTVERSLECELDMKDIPLLDYLWCGHTVCQNDDKVCVYGVWANDLMHQTFLLTVELGMHIKRKDHVEIHPREQTWWQKQYNDTTRYYCLLAADDSKRFFSPENFDPYKGTMHEPWAMLPLKGVFAIAFEKKITQQLPLNFVLHTIDANQAQTINPDAQTQYALMNNADTLAALYLSPNDAPFYKVSFEQVGIAENGNLKGFMVIESAVGNKGKTDKESHGGYLFYWVEQVN